MRDGWIKLHRRLQDKGFYKNSKYVHLWIHLLLKANHKPQEIMWDGKTFILQPGQFITGRKKIAEKTRINRSSVERILNYFKNEHQIEQQKTTKGRLITILKWKRYQGDEQQNEQQVSNKRATSEQQVSTNKKDKNVKNVKKEKNTTAATQKIFFSLKEKKWGEITAGDIKAWAETYPACNIEIELCRMREWLLANPNKVKKNYRRFIVNWLSRTQDKGGTKGVFELSREAKPETPEERLLREIQEQEIEEREDRKRVARWQAMSAEELAVEKEKYVFRPEGRRPIEKIPKELLRVIKGKKEGGK